MKKKYLIGIILGVFILFFLSLIFYVFSKKYTNEYFHLTPYHSLIDKDLDGIDDQTDILKNARDYLATKPKYKSKYYAGGYANDEFGVCTDVVAVALVNAGYDLRELVDQDIILHNAEYQIVDRDKNIDFRRVSNLNLYFSHHAISLTTNLDDHASWQGGDIVVFAKHIGIVSDVRNKRGIPFVLHHANPWQIFYEEDILKSKEKEIVGHYRIS